MHGEASGKSQTKEKQGGSSTPTYSTKDLYTVRLKKENKKHEKQAKTIQKDFDSLVKDIKSIELINDEDFEHLSSKIKLFQDAVITVKERPIYAKYIPAFREKFDMISMDECTETQLCDFVKIYQALDIYRTAQEVENDIESREPTFYKIMYKLEQLIREGNDQLAKRWPRDFLEFFWSQLY